MNNSADFSVRSESWIIWPFESVLIGFLLWSKRSSQTLCSFIWRGLCHLPENRGHILSCVYYPVAFKLIVMSVFWPESISHIVCEHLACMETDPSNWVGKDGFTMQWGKCARCLLKSPAWSLTLHYSLQCLFSSTKGSCFSHVLMLDQALKLKGFNQNAEHNLLRGESANLIPWSIINEEKQIFQDALCIPTLLIIPASWEEFAFPDIKLILSSKKKKKEKIEWMYSSEVKSELLYFLLQCSSLEWAVYWSNRYLS